MVIGKHRYKSYSHIAETGKILPAVFGSWRYDKTYNPYTDIRKNLFEHYDSKMEPKLLPS